MERISDLSRHFGVVFRLFDLQLQSVYFGQHRPLDVSTLFSFASQNALLNGDFVQQQPDEHKRPYEIGSAQRSNIFLPLLYRPDFILAQQ